jgi:hypothetical protein
MSLNDQLKSFRKSLASQPVYGVKRSAAAGSENKNESKASSTPGTPAIANNTKAAYESSMEGKKKNKRANQGVGMKHSSHEIDDSNEKAID